MPAVADASAPGEPPARGATPDVAERTSGSALLTGGGILAVAMLLANGGNYLLNLVLGRWLTPSAFADANLMVTLMLLVTAVAVSLQLVAARFGGIHQAAGTDARADALARDLERKAAVGGVALALAFVAGAGFWSDFFRTESAWPFVILGVGMPFYLVQAVGRGILQGRLIFGRLAATFVVEMVVRVGVGLGLVAAGAGVEGATAGLTVSFVATWLVVRRWSGPWAPGTPTRGERRDLRVYIGPVAVLLLGQIVINNGDVLVVKRFFSGDDAGVYAAIALIGRAVFFLSWSAVTTLFPAVAQREEAGHSSGGLLLGGVVVVSAICAGMVGGVAIFGDLFLTGALGDEYSGVGSLLIRYAIATSFFAVANLIVSHHLSAGRVREAWILLAGGVLQTVLLLTRHGDMLEVIYDQMIAMGILLVAVAVSSLVPTAGQLRDSPNRPKENQTDGSERTVAAASQ